MVKTDQHTESAFQDSDSFSQEELKTIRLGVKTRAIELLFKNGLRAIAFNILNPIILVAIFLAESSHPYFYLWVGLLTIIVILRYLHTLRRLSEMSRLKQYPLRYVYEFILAASITGLVWGVGFVVLRPFISTVNEIIFLFVLGGMAAGAFTSMATHRLSFAVFLLSMFIPVIVSLITLPSSAVSGGLLSAFLIVFTSMLLITHRISNSMILAGIHAEFSRKILYSKLQEVNHDLLLARNNLSKQANTDELTGLHNRRSFNDTLEVEWKRALRLNQYLSCIIIDIDYFKRFNDTYGHAMGDEGLKHVARIIQSSLMRPQDFACRYGGEEMVVLLPNTDIDGATAVARRLHSSIRNTGVNLESGESPVTITVSAGVASLQPMRDEDPMILLKHADIALYEAKGTGRDRVEVASEDLTRSNMKLPSFKLVDSAR